MEQGTKPGIPLPRKEESMRNEDDRRWESLLHHRHNHYHLSLSSQPALSVTIIIQNPELTDLVGSKILYVYNECVKLDHDEANTRVFHAYHAEIIFGWMLAKACCEIV